MSKYPLNAARYSIISLLLTNFIEHFWLDIIPWNSFVWLDTRYCSSQNQYSTEIFAFFSIKSSLCYRHWRYNHQFCVKFHLHSTAFVSKISKQCKKHVLFCKYHGVRHQLSHFHFDLFESNLRSNARGANVFHFLLIKNIKKMKINWKSSSW